MRGSAEFLVRAFAARRASLEQRPEDARRPSFESALFMCRDDPETMDGYVKREEAREKAVKSRYDCADLIAFC